MGGQIDVVYAVIEYVDYEGYKEPVWFLLDAEEAVRIAQIYMETYKNTTYEVLEIDNLKQVSGYFTSDGFEMEFTCDPKELRALTPDFKVEEWVKEHYSSCDGFFSYVPGGKPQHAD